jgi:hypothetical protein
MLCCFVLCHSVLLACALFCNDVNLVDGSFFFLGVEWDRVRLVRRPLIGLLYQPQMIDDECGAVGGMRSERGNRSTHRKPTPVPLSPPQIPHDLIWARTRAWAIWWMVSWLHVLQWPVCAGMSWFCVETKWRLTRFEVFTAVTMKKADFWDVAPCSSYVNRRFKGTYRLRL